MSPAAIAFWLIAIFAVAAVCAFTAVWTAARHVDADPFEEPEERHLRAVHESGHSVPAKSLGNVVTFTPDRAGRWHVEEGSAS